ncbi:MAG: hypothetical protein KatS3mg055_2800 [Chloroflexus sp.]|nr:MAG: hypothetical protein KatS3mg055_2800 [Chloroflexus sp.]
MRAQHVGFLMGLVMLASIPDRAIATTRGCLRDRSLNGADKQGATHGHKRRTLTATTCVALLLRWVAALHPTDTCPLALAKDAAPRGQRFTVFSGHVVIWGCSIPLAGKIVRATAQGARRPHREALVTPLASRTPAGWMVIVLADRGRYA